MNVLKRDGRQVNFDKQKIVTAILKAYEEVDGVIETSSEEKAQLIADYVENMNKKTMSVEEIQDIVEKKLMSTSRKDVAKAYVIYRNDRTRIRERNSSLITEISEKIMAENVQNQNANVDEKSFGGRVGEASDSVMKKYALDYCMSEMARNNHLSF